MKSEQTQTGPKPWKTGWKLSHISLKPTQKQLGPAVINPHIPAAVPVYPLSDFFSLRLSLNSFFSCTAP